jgi:hypothetical protein
MNPPGGTRPIGLRAFLYSPSTLHPSLFEIPGRPGQFVSTPAPCAHLVPCLFVVQFLLAALLRIQLQASSLAGRLALVLDVRSVTGLSSSNGIVMRLIARQAFQPLHGSRQ